MKPAALVELVRNGVVESLHLGHVAVADVHGALLFGAGEPACEVYVRSAAKPFQAAAVVEQMAAAGLELDARGLAIAAASHAGSADHQVEAARLLAVAGLDEEALRCPPALPADLPALLAQGHPTALAHNCSGKHAAFLLAQVVHDSDPGRYLRRDTRVQRSVRARLAEASGRVPAGPGVDGCGAPAWRLPLAGLATAFARLVTGADDAARAVGTAMRARPDLVGGPGCVDTALMLADPRMLAKRGAEGVLAVGYLAAGSAVGVAVKIADGGSRAVGPAAAAVLRALGAALPADLTEPAVLGGGRRQGTLRPAADLLRRLPVPND